MNGARIIIIDGFIKKNTRTKTTFWFTVWVSMHASWTKNMYMLFFLQLHFNSKVVEMWRITETSQRWNHYFTGTAESFLYCHDGEMLFKYLLVDESLLCNDWSLYNKSQLPVISFSLQPQTASTFGQELSLLYKTQTLTVKLRQNCNNSKSVTK